MLQTRSIAIPIDEEDRISSLPDDLIHHILSLIDPKYAVQTSLLSTRWKHLWKSMPIVSLNSRSFNDFDSFSSFVTQFLSHRDNHSLCKLNCYVEDSESILEEFAQYRVFDNLQHLNISSQVELIFPPSVFNSQSLKHLSITSYNFNPNEHNLPWNLPALTTLYLSQVICTNSNHKSLDLFSNLLSLKNLTLVDWHIKGLDVFSIVSPQLKNLQMINIVPANNLCEFIILCPNLSSFTYKDNQLPLISTKDLNCLDEVYIDVSLYSTKNICQKIINMLTQLGHAKFVTLSLHTIKALSLISELLVNQRSPFCKMERLKIERNHWQRNTAFPTAVLTYLCNTSPSCKVINECNRLKLVTGDYYIPKKNDLKPLGEDASFISKEYQTIGVADGVGSWAKKGIDAGKYARELMSNVELSIRKNYQGGENVDPKLILNEAFLQTKSEGSSTACIVTLKNIVSHNYLHAANIGDSGFLVIRDGKIVYKSPVQQETFNCPYQLGNSSNYSPNSAMELDFPVMAGDIIVVGTDGLFDNAYDYGIEHVVNLSVKKHERPQHPKVLASRIAKYAFQRAKDCTYYSPFEKAARQAGSRHVGGKYDDITVVVAYVRPEDESDDSYLQPEDDEFNSSVDTYSPPSDYEFNSNARWFDLQGSLDSRVNSILAWWWLRRGN